MKLSGFYSIPTTTPYTSVFGFKPPSVDAAPPVDKQAYVPFNQAIISDSFQRSTNHFSPTSLGAQFNQFKLVARKQRQSSQPVSITYGFQQQDQRSGMAGQAGVRVLHRKKNGQSHFVADVVAYDPLDFSQNLTLGPGMRRQLPQLEQNRVPQQANAYRFIENGRIALAKELNVETRHRPMAQRLVNGLRKATEYLKPLKNMVSVAPDNTVTLFGRSFNPVDVHTDTETGLKVTPMRLMRFGDQVIQMQPLAEKGLSGKVFGSAKEALNQLTQWTAQLEQTFGYERRADKTRLFQGEGMTSRSKPIASKPTNIGASNTADVEAGLSSSTETLPLHGVALSGFNAEALKRLSVVPNPFSTVSMDDVTQGLAKALEAQLDSAN